MADSFPLRRLFISLLLQSVSSIVENVAIKKRVRQRGYPSIAEKREAVSIHWPQPQIAISRV